MQSETDQPRLRSCKVARPARRADHPTQLPFDDRGPTDCYRFSSFGSSRRRVVAAPALARYRPEEYKPGAHLTSDGELAKAAGDTSTTILHPVGTAKMGPDNDPMAVVDARLRVRGLDCVRVIDASIMPHITSGNTNSPTMMIAEKGAEIVLQDAGG